MAASDSKRIVLAYGPSAGGWVERILKTLPRRSRRLWKIGDASENVPSRLAGFASLRLRNEILVAAETNAADAERLAAEWGPPGASGFFVLRPELPERRESGEEASPAANLRRRTVLALIRKNRLILDRAHSALTEAARMGRPLTDGARWIVDNSWLIRAHVAQLRRELPRNVSPGASGRLASDIHRLAQILAVTTDGALTEDNIREYLRSVQTACPLTSHELWAFPLFLRVALIQILASRAAREDENQQLRELARLWANRLANAARAGGEACARMLDRLDSEPAARRPPFMAALAGELRDEEAALQGVCRWMQERSDIPLSDLARRQPPEESARAVGIANSYTSLRTLGQLEYAEIFEAVSLVDAELRADPAGVYQHSDFETRDRCRRAVERISLQSGIPEREIARRATELTDRSDDLRTGNVAWYLLAGGITCVEQASGARIGNPLRIRRFAVRHATAVYITTIVLLTACFMALSLVLAREAGVQSWAILAALAAGAAFTLSELSVQIAHALIISLLPPEPLPKMNYRAGIPAVSATLVVVPTMLTNCDAVRADIGRLEVRYLSNRDDNIFFSIFSDFTDSPVATDPGDEQLLRAAVEGINDLNARYPGGRFLLFHRPRTWSDGEQAWIGRERKRGKIEDLNAYLCGEGTGNILVAGRLPPPVAYVITVDSDTQLPLESARRLIETIAHPLNRVEINPSSRVRTQGYTIIQPRISIALPAATATRFTRIFADTNGTDPYCRMTSDAQQELFSEGIFHGKAIYDVKAFHAILKDRFPAETILSHDLIEGAHAGVGLASDIELFENMPTDYGSYAARQRRWIRGDWQIAPWMFGQVPLPTGKKCATPLNAIGRWRILDNLRRSLIPVAAVGLLLFGWLMSSAPGTGSLVVGLAVAIPAFAPLLDRLARRLHGSVRGWQGAADDLRRAAVMIAFLPHQAWLAVDSIARVCYRRWFSHRKMLEWQTAERVQVLGRQHLDATFRQLLVVSILSMVLAVVLVRHSVWAPAVLFVGLWIFAPLLMSWLASPDQPEQAWLPQNDIWFLRRAARRTWRYFDDLIGAQTNWLPPDNSQVKHRIEVAQRTSPTNIGLWFTSALAAWDFGYLTTDEMVTRCGQTLETLKRLERCDTHFLNWYDTHTLAPLNPRYISTVDSGNLVAALWVFAQGCVDAMGAPVIGSVAFRGLSDTLAVFREVCGKDPSASAPLRELRSLLRRPNGGHEFVSGLDVASAAARKLVAAQLRNDVPGNEQAYWASRLSEQLAAWNETAHRYLRWMAVLASMPDTALQEIDPELVSLRRSVLRSIPSLKDLAGCMPASVASILSRRCAQAVDTGMAAWFDRIAGEYADAQAEAAQRMARLEALRTAVQQLAEDTNFGVLYDRRHRLFGIGHDPRAAGNFTSHYDLLASESRLTSLVAIAKGDVPAEHWFALSRPWIHSFRRGQLLSWSGTMFEYLMPPLFTRIFTNSLLHGACRSAVKCHIEYGERNAVPWGISESAHADSDSRGVYQYRAFGVPELALNPDIGSDTVVAPYATMLALPLAPRAALENLRRLEKTGLAGPMGYYESVDFRSECSADDSGGSVVGCYMAHHQGMSLAALSNLLHRNIMQRRFHNDPRIRSVETLLCERVPVVPLPAEERKLRQTPARVPSAGKAAAPVAAGVAERPG